MRPGGGRKKGHDWERAVAEKFREAGFTDAKRGLSQTRGGEECADVEGIPGWWVETKHHRLARIPAAYEQAAGAAFSHSALARRPVVVSRDDRRPPLATVSFPVFLALLARIRDLEARNVYLDSALKEAVDARAELQRACAEKDRLFVETFDKTTDGYEIKRRSSGGAE